MIISDGINHSKLQIIIVGELKKAGLKHRLKKIILKSVRDNKTVFGAPLSKVPSCSVICCGSTINIPTVVNEMSAILRNNAHIEGIFRKAGSQNRQKDIKRLLDSGGCVSEGHHPIDVASVLKLYLRTLPEPLISAEVQDLLLRCRVTAERDALDPILHTLLLLPVLHVHLLHYIMELLNFISTKNKSNLMDTSNLAIVMAPSIMPLPVAASAQRLEHHVALVKLFIENSQHIGILSDELMSQLDDDSEACMLRRKKRRSGSLNRVFHGLRKMVSGSVNTPATVRESGHTPILTKSASKRKMDSYDGLSAKTRKEIKKNLPQNQLLMTPMKMGITDKKRLRLSLNDVKSSQKDFARKYETHSSSEDLLTSSEHLFSTHDTIDLSPDTKQIEKDYVKISKHEYEEIKNRVSAIENRLSREFTDVPNVEPIQQVQDVYKQTLEEVAMLQCPSSDHLARRLSKELKIRPNEHNKIIRSPSARKIGTIRRRSKENIPKIVRHKSWNASTLSQASHACSERFYPYVPLSRNSRVENKHYPSSVENNCLDQAWSVSDSENSLDNSDSSHKYNLRKRISDAFAYKNITTRPSRRSLNVTTIWDSRSESSMNSTLNSSDKTQWSPNVNEYVGPEIKSQRSPQQKWKSAAAFFMTRTGEMESGSHTGRPSVNKLRRQNAGAVLAKAKMFESSSDRSSDKNNEKSSHTGFARKPRVSGVTNNRNKVVATVKPRMYVIEAKCTNGSASRLADNPPAIPTRTYKPRVNDIGGVNKKLTPPARKVISSPTSNTPVLKKSLVPQKHLRTPNFNNDTRKLNTPLRAIHTSPRRRSPRLKYQRGFTPN